MKKLFVCTIPMLEKNKLKKLDYQNEKGEFMKKSAFPGIVMLNKYIDEDSEKNFIVTIRDDSENSAFNHKRFIAELDNLSAEKGVSITVDKEIIIQHHEGREKHLSLFSELMELYSKNEKCKLFIDFTYGSKPSAIEIFSSLAYAEVKKLSIEEICYGFYDHAIKDNKIGVYYSLRYIYDLLSLINSSSAFMPSEKIESLLKGLI